MLLENGNEVKTMSPIFFYFQKKCEIIIRKSEMPIDLFVK